MVLGSGRANAWLDGRPLARLALTAVVVGIAYAGSQVWLADEEPHSALVLGAVFGVVFAGVQFLARHVLGD